MSIRTGVSILAAAMTVVAAALIWHINSGNHLRDLPACPSEDSGTNCFWDANSRGNGQGQSFWVDSDGNAHYVR